MYGLPAELLNAVAHTPDDDTPRLACADWLDEHGDPDAAAYIRVSVTAASLKRSHRRPGEESRAKRRGAALWAANVGRWVPAAVTHIAPIRGFPLEIRLTAESENGLNFLRGCSMVERLLGSGAEVTAVNLSLPNLREWAGGIPHDLSASSDLFRYLLRQPRLRCPVGSRLEPQWYAARRQEFAHATDARRRDMDAAEDWRREPSRWPAPLRLGTLGSDECAYALDRAAALGLRGRAVWLGLTRERPPSLTPVSEAQWLHLFVNDGTHLTTVLRAFPQARRVELYVAAQWRQSGGAVRMLRSALPKLCTLRVIGLNVPEAAPPEHRPPRTARQLVGGDAGTLVGPLVPVAPGLVWRENGDATEWPHPEAGCVARAWAVERDALPGDWRDRLVAGDALARASVVGPLEFLRAPGDPSLTGIAWASPVLCGYRALALSDTRAARLEVTWGSELGPAWRGLARRLAGSLELA